MTCFSWYWYVMFHHFIHLCSGTEPKTQLLLRWCIAASFSTGALEVTGGATQGEVLEVRFIPKDGVTEDEMRRYLQDVLGHFGVDDHFKDIRTGKKGDFLHTFGKVVLRDAWYKPWTLLKTSRGNMQCFGAKAKTIDPTGLRGSATWKTAWISGSRESSFHHLSPCFIESNSFPCYVVEDFEVSMLCCGWIMWWTTFYLWSCLFGG